MGLSQLTLTLPCSAEADGGPYEVQLIKDLTANYNPYERPSPVDNKPLKVEFQVTLRNIIDVVSARCFAHYKNLAVFGTMTFMIRIPNFRLRKIKC